MQTIIEKNSNSWYKVKWDECKKDLKMAKMETDQKNQILIDIW